LSFCADDSACASSETCALLQQCGNPVVNYCISAGASATCPSNCAPLSGYCHTRDICDATVYATPVVPIAALPVAASALGASLAAHTPDGFTPMAPALTGAIAQARLHAQAHPSTKIAIVLVTDGLPGGFTDLYSGGALIRGIPRPECDPTDIPGIATILTGGAGGPVAVSTYVIGLFSPAEATAGQAQAKLDALAAAGGTGRSVVIDTGTDVAAQLRSALSATRAAAVACTYQIPQLAGGVVDLGKVNVKVTAGAGQVTMLGYRANQAACDATVGGWFYDVQPGADAASPTAIKLCDATCTQLLADTGARLDVELGCETRR
jgi:hypothetical protein